jgi:hypothetical protein
MPRPGFEPGSPQWEASDYPLEVWRGQKQDKLQWLQDPSQMNGYLNNLRPETSIHFSNKKRKHIKTKI